MYLEHFGLLEPPFKITPHTEFFFAGANRGPTLGALTYAILHDEGIVKVTGEVGSGKTMLCRVVMERLPSDSVAIAYLANPSLSREEILYAIADELHIPLPDQTRPGAALKALQEGLIQLYAEGKRAVVLVDEAHAMPAETLEEIRLLSNLDTNAQKLLQLVLFGQPELNDTLARADMRQLKERITHNFELEPLVRNDVAEYIEFRLRAAGYKGPNLFASAAVKAISAASLGLTRRINILADKALLAAYAKGSYQIDVNVARSAIRDCDFSSAPGQRRLPTSVTTNVIRYGGVTVLVLAALLLGNYLGQHRAPLSEAAHASAATSEVEKASSAEIAASNPPSSTTPAATTPSSLTAAIESQSTTWLTEGQPERWFLQLFATDANQEAQIETYLQRFQTVGGTLDALHIYRSDLSGRMRIGVTYGDFASRDEARRAIAALPTAIRQGNPYPRQLRQLIKSQ